MERHAGAFVKRAVSIGALVLAACVLMIPATNFYFETGQGTRCTSCHEMQPVYDLWRASSHRGVGCGKCHGDVLTAGASFYLNNMKRTYSHLEGDLPEQIGFGNEFVLAIEAKCESCHRQEYASWKSGPHSASYSRIFLDKKHNTRNMLMDDCLRCHGMYFEGGVADLVTPVNRGGPWRLTSAELAGKASMPCVTCHILHREGRPMTKIGASGRAPGPSQEIARPSLAFFDRRTKSYVPIGELPMPTMLEGNRAVKMSKDRRQALCYQCHAPTAAMQVGSGDDRTGLGVHEGIGCLACHAEHGEKTRASCANCHPKMSNCGLDVETMDTTFVSENSKHNIHWVKCADCHTKGVPKKKVTENLADCKGCPSPSL